MDDTQPSRVSDAAATRKRRSSILKSQRPTRTPFSELEFNVATPTDTAKSRRVSFSKRTGVAEFVTNEATTTWKNFYEEHNKSLESSGNDSEVKATRQPVEHLGKRIFDQQFEEVEAVDFMGSFNPYLGNNSLNNINFTEQIASLECPSDIKLNPPRNNFELSALTDHHSKLFGNDFTVTAVGEMSGRIEVNFSTVQHIGGKDDIDDIERDLERGTNVVCLGPSDRHDISEYIEVDLNMTNVVKNDDCDMSITDTVHSPKVQNVSISCSIDKKVSVNKDVVIDKENIAINPYAAPRESDNFAVNDVPNQVLVFDGKRLTLQTEKSDKEYRKTLLPSTATETPQRKTIVLNMDDDLPNFVSCVSTKTDIDSKYSNIYNDFELSAMPHMNKLDSVPRRQTVHDNTGNISITQALPSKIISGGAEKRRTIVYGEEGNISITQGLPSKIISGPGRRGTMVYNEEDSNITITQAVHSNIISDKRQTLVHDVDEEVNISVTQALPSNIISGAADKRRTMVYEQEDGNIWMTQALPTNIISKVAERRRTVAHNADDSVNVSMTQALPSDIISGITDRRRTLVYDQDDGNISMTQALPSNIISGVAEKHRTIIYDDDMDTNISITQALPSKIINAGEEKRRTKVFDQEDASICLTQGLPSNILSGNAEKRRTIVYNDDNGDANISMTQVLPSNIVSGAVDKRRTMVFDDDEANISITQTLPTKLISGVTDKRQTKIFDQDETNNLSITQPISVQIITDSAKPTERRRMVLYENDSGNISITQMLPASIVQSDDPDLNEIRKTVIFDESNGNISVTKSVPVNSNVEQNVPQKQKTIVFDNDDGNISIIDTECEEKRRTVIYDDKTGNISITQSTLTNMNLSQKPMSPEKRRTIVYHDNTGNISVTQGIQGFEFKDKSTIVFENDTGNISVTQAIPSQLLQGIDSKSTVTATRDDMSTNSLLTCNEDFGKPKTIINDEDTKDISAAQLIYANIIKPTKDVDKDKSIVIKQDDCKKPAGKKAAAVAFLLSGVESHSYGKLKDISGIINDKTKIDGGDSEMSIADIDPKVQQIGGLINKNIKIDGNDTNNVTRPIPVDLMALHDNMLNVLVTKEPSSTAQITNQNQDVLLYQSTTSDIAPTVNKIEPGRLIYEAPFDENDSNMTSSSKIHDIDEPECLSNKVCSEDPSLLLKENAGHVIESKLDVYNMQANVRDEAMDVDKQSDISDRSVSAENTFRVVTKSSVLDALLDISDVTSQRQTQKTAVNTESLPPNDAEPVQLSNESLFYIIREEDALMQTEKEKSNEELAKPAEEESNSPPLVEDVMVAVETNVPDSSVLQKKLNELHLEQKCDSGSPEKLEVVAESELENIVESDDHKPLHKSFKNANDTKELLDMISDFTDKTRCELEDDSVLPKIVKENVAVENKIEPIRLSFAPNRQSIVFSREDLLNNISMAQAALQKSRIELDDSETDETQDTFTEGETNTSPKSDRMSREVVKTLHFDDESISVCSIKSDASKPSPLRKTAFGETSYMKDSKAKVIPSYLKDVSDGIKVLMSDLVKPMADVLPFNAITERAPKKTISTTSTQIQANLVTSSQIDMEEVLTSNSNSDCAMENASSFCLRNNILKVPSLSMKLHPSHSEELPTNLLDVHPLRPKCAPEDAGQVLIFDHSNPLNNILLRPLDYANAHTYNPGTAPINQLPQKSDETLCGSEHSASCQANGEPAIKDCDMHSETKMTKYNVSMMLSPKKKECPEKLAGDVFEEQSAVIHTTDVKNAEVNTIIAMKENKELLNASSSLTLVDEAMVETTTDDNTSRTESDSSKDLQSKNKRSPLRVIYKVEELDGVTIMEKVETDTAPQEDKQMKIKSNKRNYKPSSLMTAVLPNVDITPKPKSKMQKISNSPVKFNLDVSHTATKTTAERDIETHEPVMNEKVDLKPRKNSPRKNKDKPNSSAFNMQQMITDYHVETVITESVLRKKCLEAMKSECSNADRTSQSDVLEYNSLEDVSSFTSSNYLHALKSGESASTNISGMKSQSTVSSLQSCKSGWHPNMNSLSFSPSMIDSGVNIVAKIDMLPFMGSRECEWESSTADTWCFRLLHGRIRLMVRLAHSHANAIKSRVRADTPVNDITVETIQYEKRNPISSLCMRFACETMQYMVSRTRGGGRGGRGGRGAVLARAVPALLRRCAAVARVALRWGRAMHDTKMQLAYSLDNDGHLTLKVANIPLRSVWEVSLRLELVMLDTSLTPWPRACAVRVARVVSDVRVDDADVRRVLASTPQDWGHAPRTIWRIFRYLKNKTRDDDLLMGV